MANDKRAGGSGLKSPCWTPSVVMASMAVKQRENQC